MHLRNETISIKFIPILSQKEGNMKKVLNKIAVATGYTALGIAFMMFTLWLYGMAVLQHMGY